MLLGKVFSEDWVNATLALDEQSNQAISGVSQGTADVIGYIRQTILIILEDICSSVVTTTAQKVHMNFTSPELYLQICLLTMC